jgi:hypothetical protein
LRPVLIAAGALLALFFFTISDLWAISVSESRIFAEGPYLFKVEVQVGVRGRVKSNPLQMTSFKLKIKNDRASSKTLVVKAIRAYLQPQVYQDIETGGFSVTPAQWVTKFYRLPKAKQPLLRDESRIEIVFEDFAIRFNPRDRKFQGPIKQ